MDSIVLNCIKVKVTLMVADVLALIRLTFMWKRHLQKVFSELPLALSVHWLKGDGSNMGL